jgi:biopolymer transport protein ExbD
MAMAVGNSEGRSFTDINMTPLIDVMLVLLIIFIITLPGETHAIKIDNPSPSPNPPASEVIDLSIDFDGTLLWNKQPVDRATLQGLVSSNASKTPQPEVHISIDRFAKYEIVDCRRSASSITTRLGRRRPWDSTSSKLRRS